MNEPRAATKQALQEMQQAPEHQRRQQRAQAEVTQELAEFAQRQERERALACYRAALREKILPAIAASGQWDQPLDQVWGQKLQAIGIGTNVLDDVVMEEVMRFGGVKRLEREKL